MDELTTDPVGAQTLLDQDNIEAPGLANKQTTTTGESFVQIGILLMKMPRFPSFPLPGGGIVVICPTVTN